MFPQFIRLFCPFLFGVAALLLFGITGYADCGRPHDSGSTGGGSPTDTGTTDSGGSTGGGSVLTTPGTEGSTTEQHLGTTFDPNSADESSSVSVFDDKDRGRDQWKKDADLLALQHLAKIKIDPNVWKNYVQYIHEMSNLLKTHKRALTSEYRRRTGWAKVSGLRDARKSHDSAEAKNRKALYRYWDVKEATEPAIREYNRRYVDYLLDQSMAENQSATETAREKARQQMEDFNNDKALHQAAEAGRRQRQEAFEKVKATNDEALQEWDKLREALSRYRALETKYNAQTNAPIPQPSGR